MFKTLRRDYKNLANIDGRWLAIWCIIYLSFLTLDLFFPNFMGTAAIKYIGIFLCIIYAYAKYRKDLFMVFALFFTFLADTILVWTSWIELGLFVFCIAQFFHLLRFNRNYAKQLTFGALFTIIFFGLLIMFRQPILYALAPAYALLLVTNLTFAAIRVKKHPKNIHNRYGLYGFIAFVCCDINVCLQRLMLDGIIPDMFLQLVSYLVWFFYYPSQVLIANSSDTEPIKIEKRRKLR